MSELETEVVEKEVLFTTALSRERFWEYESWVNKHMPYHLKYPRVYWDTPVTDDTAEQEIRDWCNRNVKKTWMLTDEYIAFKDETDAFWYKMFWL